MIKNLSLAPLLIAILNSAAFAVEGNDTGELLQLMAILDEQTEIATKTKLNADYVPGLVTVLHGHDLASRGARTVWDGLALVPGIELSIEETGRKQVVVRGVGRTYASGNVKLMLNGISMNTAQNGLADPVFNIPVQQVERIEVIRGPGSAVHGEYAFAGVVNVITRSNEDELFTSVANDNGYTVGGNLSHQSEDGSWKMNLNVAATGSDGATINSGPDMDPAITHSPGPTNEIADYRAALFNLNHGDFGFKLQWVENGFGDHFGINYELPPPTKNIVTRYSFTAAEAEQAFHPNDKLDGHVKLGWQNSREDKDNLYAYESWDPGITKDIIVDSAYGEERLYGSVDLTWTGIQNHTLFAEMSSSYVRAYEALQKYNIDPVTFDPTPPDLMFNWGDYPISDGKSRHINSLTLQDEYRANEALTVTAGVRYDTYSDVGDSINPRLAAVWLLDRHHTIKAQYAHAFRPSSFYELGGSVAGLDPATIDSVEFSHIYRTPKTTIRAVLFGSRIDNLVVFDDGAALGFSSIEAEIQGIELELEQRLSRQIKVMGDLSYVDTYDVSTGKQLVFSSNWLSNLGFSYQPVPQWMTNVQLRYVGERNRESADNRSNLDAYSSVDATVSRFDIVPGMTLRAGAKNLFNQDVRYPAPLDTYAEDYPRPGRQWWLELNYRF